MVGDHVVADDGNGPNCAVEDNAFLIVGLLKKASIRSNARLHKLGG